MVIQIQCLHVQTTRPLGGLYRRCNRLVRCIRLVRSSLRDRCNRLYRIALRFNSLSRLNLSQALVSHCQQLRCCDVRNVLLRLRIHLHW